MQLFKLAWLVIFQYATISLGSRIINYPLADMGSLIGSKDYDIYDKNYDTLIDNDYSDDKDYADEEDFGGRDEDFGGQTFRLRIQDGNGVDFLTTDDIVKKATLSADRGRVNRNVLADDIFIQEHVQCQMNISMLNLFSEFGRNWHFYGFDDFTDPKIRTAKCQHVPDNTKERVPVPCKQSFHRPHQHLCYLRGKRCETLRKEVFIWKKHRVMGQLDQETGEWMPERLEIDAGCACHSEFHWH